MEHTAEEWLQIILKKQEDGLYAEAIEIFDHVFQIDLKDTRSFVKLDDTKLNLNKSPISK